MILATLDLLRQSGLAGAGINPIVEASGAPKGSLYHFFPGGKHALVIAALKEAERVVGDGFRAIFHQTAPLPQKVRSLFGATATRLEGSAFTKGCPVAAVTLDIDDDSEELRTICHRVFTAWLDVIAIGLNDVPAAQRAGVAELILATLEGGLVLARAAASKDPLIQTGAVLAMTLESVVTRSRTGTRRGRPRSARKPRRGRQ
jgi:TetR/AcrR family transcriptional regulator, lmrAB and yxaGH operons repressor